MGWTRLWQPLAATTASHLRRIEPINRWIKNCGMLFHSCTSASRSSCSVFGGFWRWRTRLIMMLRHLLIFPYLLCPYESKLYDFCRCFFSM
jgi:hypothetical protein